MPVNESDSEAAPIALSKEVAGLNRHVAEGTLEASEMILACRRILNAWIAKGGASLDDEVITFLAIESQSDHVLGGSQVRVGRDVDHVRFEPRSQAELDEIEELGRFFKDNFKRGLDELTRHLDGS